MVEGGGLEGWFQSCYTNMDNISFFLEIPEKVIKKSKLPILNLNQPSTLHPPPFKEKKMYTELYIIPL
jgi:hypothetical protein